MRVFAEGQAVVLKNMCTRTFKKVRVRRNQMRCNFQSLVSEEEAKVDTGALTGENPGRSPKGG